MERPGTTRAAERSFRQPLLIVLALLAIVILPMAPMLRLGWWPNHPDTDSAAWQIARCGRYFAVHGQFPITLDSERFAGSAQPIFYAPILFPLLGLLSNITGAAVAMQLAAIAVWLLQGLLVYRIGRTVTGQAWWAMAVAALVSWTIYPLNNLYHRGGVAEFFATGLLTCAICAGGLAMLERRRGVKVAMLLLCAWCGALAAGSHTITAVVGGVTAGCLTLAAFPIGLRTLRHNHISPTRDQNRRRSRRRRRLATTAMICAVALTAAPWIYVTARFGGRVEVAGKTGVLVHEPDHDSLWVRLLPFPINASPDLWPHNNPQANTPLLLVLIWTLLRLAATWRNVRGIGRQRMVLRWVQWGTLLRVSLILLVGSIVLSTSATLIHSLPKAFSFIQYSYRLISYSNLSMLAALLAATAILGKPAVGARPLAIGRAVRAIVLTLSVTGLGLKLALAVRTFVPADLSAQWQRDPDSAANAPSRYHAQKDYAVSDDSRLLANESATAFKGVRAVVLPIGTGSHFGITQPLDVRQETAGWIQTSVVAFPWNQMLIDGVPAAPERVREMNYLLAVHVPEGSHTVGYRPAADTVWLTLRWIGFAAFGLLSVTTLAAYGYAAARRSCRVGFSPPWR